jgi:uncharacterized membrane protein
VPSDSATKPFPTKARLLTVFVIVSNVAGNLFLSLGMKGSGLFFLALGAALLTAWMVARTTLLSWADLSYVLPVTSIGYVLSAVAGVVFLGEHVSATRWLATLLIVAGTALAGSTAYKT